MLSKSTKSSTLSRAAEAFFDCGQTQVAFRSECFRREVACIEQPNEAWKVEVKERLSSFACTPFD
jgi:hypothetical protein